MTGFAEYEKALKQHKVVLDPATRAASINEGAHALAKDAHLTLVEDDALAAENAGLTEWPTVLMGEFDKSFLDVPAECLTTSMKTHQKCFSLRHGKKLSNHFLLVTNQKAKDGGKTIVAGNEKVIAARLSDAKFFWEQDLKKKLEIMRDELKGITFHEKLGTQFERAERVKELARQIATSQELCEAALAQRAAELAKADLVSGMVGEFPELQGLMGRYYAEAEHMNPADRARHRAALQAEGADRHRAAGERGRRRRGRRGAGRQARHAGRLLGHRRKADRLGRSLSAAPRRARRHPHRPRERSAVSPLSEAWRNSTSMPARQLNLGEASSASDWRRDTSRRRAFNGRDRRMARVSDDLLAFFAERLKVYLRDKGARHDLIDAIFSLPGQDDLALIVKRVEALTEFLKTDDGANLLAGVKRAQNILTIEEKKDKTSHAGDVDAALLQGREEKALAAAIDKVKADTVAALNVENFAGSMRALAELRAPVDAFFDKVTVNADDAALRKNRLHLLSQIRAATLNVADFTKISG